MAPNIRFRMLRAYCCSRGRDYEAINSFCHAPFYVYMALILVFDFVTNLVVLWFSWTEHNVAKAWVVNGVRQ